MQTARYLSIAEVASRLPGKPRPASVRRRLQEAGIDPLKPTRELFITEAQFEQLLAYLRQRGGRTRRRGQARDEERQTAALAVRREADRRISDIAHRIQHDLIARTRK